MKEPNTKSMSLDEIRRLKGRTDWDRLQSEGDHQGPEEFAVDWSKARLV